MKVTGKTSVVGIFGHPISHSFSPIMHNSAFRQMDLDYIYVPFLVHPDNLGEAVKGVRAMGVKGFNVTVPHKEKIIPFLDELSVEAELIGAVNTVEVRDGRLVGHNTDGLGFIKSLEVLCSPRNKTVAIIGAGGASRGVGISLALAGVKKIMFFNRTVERAEKLAGEICNKTSATAEAFPLESIFLKNIKPVDILINGTSLGMKPDDKKVLSLEHFPSKGVVVDMVYNPPKTDFLDNAQKLGLEYINGIGMLIYQGALAFEIWTMKKAPIAIMQSALEKVMYDNK